MENKNKSQKVLSVSNYSQMTKIRFNVHKVKQNQIEVRDTDLSIWDSYSNSN